MWLPLSRWKSHAFAWRRVRRSSYEIRTSAPIRASVVERPDLARPDVRRRQDADGARPRRAPSPARQRPPERRAGPAGRSTSRTRRGGPPGPRVASSLPSSLASDGSPEAFTRRALSASGVSGRTGGGEAPRTGRGRTRRRCLRPLDLQLPLPERRLATVLLGRLGQRDEEPVQDLDPAPLPLGRHRPAPTRAPVRRAASGAPRRTTASAPARGPRSPTSRSGPTSPTSAASASSRRWS